MLVLLNRPEDIDGRIPELKDIAVTHGVVKVYLARLSRDFGPRVRSVVVRHKLDMAARMGDAAADKYLRRMAGVLCGQGLDCETISAGLPVERIGQWIGGSEMDLIVIVGVGPGSSLFDLLPKHASGRLLQYVFREDVREGR